MFEQDGVKVDVKRAADLGMIECARCRKYSHDVDQDTLFPMVCTRCAETLHCIHYDVAHMNTAMIPTPLRGVDQFEFSERFMRPPHRGKSWKDLCNA